MKQLITETAIAARLVWFRVLCYFLLPAWGMFEIATDKVTGEMWAAMSSFEKNKIFGACAYAGALTLVAFIDNAVNRAKQKIQDQRSEETEKIKL